MDEETLRFYRSNAQAYAEREITKHTRLARFLALLAPGATILELGCGAGAASAEMLARGFDVAPYRRIARNDRRSIAPPRPPGRDVAVP